jgi:PAT family beta-lactamase induction signal transducer AmpG
MAESAAREKWVLSESRPLRLFSFFFLYFGQGLPLGINTVALPAWLAANGAPDADVAAIVATAYLPWSFKFLPAALMDRYAYLAMGRRRLWLISAQLIMMLAYLIAAIAAPGVEDIQLLIAISFLIGAGAAIQDVAVDGLAVDILPEREQGTASSFMFGGQTVGRAAAGAASGVLLFYFGSQATFLAFLPVIALVTLFAILLRERPGEKRFPWSRGAPSPVNLDRQVADWLRILLTTLKSLFRRDSLVLVLSSVAQRIGEGMLAPLFPILATSFLLMNEASYSGTISTIDLVMALAAIAAGSFLTLKMGAKRAAMLVFMAEAAMCVFILFGRELWTAMSVFIVLLGVQSILATLSSITTNPLRMQLSDPRVAATQFTIYNSLGNLPVSFGATLFAWLGGSAKLAMVMAVAIALFVIGTLILAMIRVGGTHAETEPVPRVD